MQASINFFVGNRACGWFGYRTRARGALIDKSSFWLCHLNRVLTLQNYRAVWISHIRDADSRFDIYVYETANFSNRGYMLLEQFFYLLLGQKLLTRLLFQWCYSKFNVAETALTRSI